MSDSRVTIRPAAPSDAGAVAALAGELGYPTTAEAIETHLRRIRRAAPGQPAAVLVAELVGTSDIVGWVHVCVPADLVKTDVADIWGLVVAATQRGLGIGRSLMAAAEAWAIDQGCRQVRLRSGSHRTEAHAFYRRLGYTIEKSQLTFSRSLVPAPDSPEGSEVSATHIAPGDPRPAQAAQAPRRG